MNSMSLNLKDCIEHFGILNIDEETSTQNVMEFALNDKPNDKAWIVSNVDAELLMLIKFKKNVNLEYIKFYEYGYNNNDFCDASTPKQVNIYKINHLNLNFVDIRSLQHDISTTISPSITNKMQKHKITLKNNSKNAIKFKQVQYLAVYIKSNHSTTHNTYLNGISFIGKIDAQDNIILIDDEKTQNQSRMSRLKSSAVWAYNNTDKSCLSITTATVSTAITVWQQSNRLLKHKKLFESITTLDDCIGIMSKSNQCIAESICRDSSKLETLKTFLEQNNNTFGKVLDNNPNIDTVKSCVKSICDKGKELSKVCSDNIFRQNLNWIHAQYIAVSGVLVCLSFAEIYIAFQSIKDATDTMKEYQDKMNTLYVDEILPILKYRDKVVNHGTIYDREECKLHTLKIEGILKQLDQFKPVIEAEKTKCTQLGIGNSIAGVAMLFATIMSATRISNAHDMSVVLGVLVAVQAIATVGHAYVAYKAYKEYKELCGLHKKLEDQMEQLIKVKQSLDAWEGEQYPLSQMDNSHLDVSSWNNKKVLEWIQQQGKKYEIIYQLFKEKNIKGRDLLKLSHGRLQAMGIKNLFKRKQLLRKISQLE